MKRQSLIWMAAVLTVVDIVIHLRRSLVPNGNPFVSPLHQQFFLYCVVAAILVVALVTASKSLGSHAWLASVALIAWEAGAIAVWLLAYHAPNPPGVLPDEGYVAKVIEALVILALLPTLRLPNEGPPRQSRPFPR